VFLPPYRKHADIDSSTRTWKSKLKDWKFEKYVTEKEKNISVAKSHGRERKGKGAAVLNGERVSSPRRLAYFKKRKAEDIVDLVTPSARKTASS
jgi:hypothetical protein